MWIFFCFILLLAGALVLAAVFTYPAWWLVSLISIEPVHRVMHRLAMLFAAIGLIYLTRRFVLADRAALGYGAARSRFFRQLAIGWLLGVALMTPLTLMLLQTGVRDWKDALSGESVVTAALAGALSGFIIAFIEETFFRGVLFTALRRSTGIIAAVAAPSALYGALHFLGGKLRVAPENVSWEHGFIVLAKLFERYAEPLVLIDSFAALFCLGVLLALVRERTGSIAACIGLHAAGVAFIALLRKATSFDPTSPYADLVGAYDGVIGWGAAFWFLLIALVVVRWRAPGQPAVNSARS